MTAPWLRSILLLFYSTAFGAMVPLVQLLARFLPQLGSQLASRRSAQELALEVAPRRAAKSRCAVFFCSSAGEYEQARPLIERLLGLGHTYVQVIFFSKSGLDYVQARGGDQVPALLAPLTDSAWQWGRLFAALRPDVVAVVRHELWPGFLETARAYAPLYLIDASRSLGESSSRLKRLMRAEMLRVFDRVYAVSQADAAFFHSAYGLSWDVLRVVGDTKYDRVRERALARKTESHRLGELLDQAGPHRLRLVAGSAHRPDVEALLAARLELGEEANPWQLVIAPHHVDPDTIDWILGRCRAAGLRVARYSELAADPDGLRPSEGAAVVVLDAMGILAEVYGTADAAYVGGALHHQVHNVLEPACHGLALAWGPFYKNSQEAVYLVQAGLAEVTGDARALADWWRRLAQGLPEKTQAVVRAVAELTGASDRIMADWQELLCLPSATKPG